MAFGDVTILDVQTAVNPGTVFPSIVNPLDNIVALTHDINPGENLNTFSIAADGTISARLDRMDHPRTIWANSVAKGSGGTVAWVCGQRTFYGAPFNGTVAETYQVDGLGNLVYIGIDTLHTPEYSVPLSSCIVTGSVNAVGARTGPGTGSLALITFATDVGGTTVLDTKTLVYGDDVFSGQLWHHKDNIYVLGVAYHLGGGNYALNLKTIQIANDGSIGATLDSWELALSERSSNWSGNRAINNIHILGLTGSPYVRTFNISDSGIFSGVYIDSLEIAGITRVNGFTNMLNGLVLGVLSTATQTFLYSIWVNLDGTIRQVRNGLIGFKGWRGEITLMPVYPEMAVIHFNDNDGSHTEIATANIEAIPLYSTVDTLAATDIGLQTTLNGELTDDGGIACDCGFEWGETIAYGNVTPTQSRTTGQTFSQVIAGLVQGRTYYFRAFSTNTAGTSYGAGRTFTAFLIPSVQTLPAEIVGTERY